MADARLRSEWAKITSLMTLMANCNRDPKRKPSPFQPSDFDPFRRKPAKIEASVRVLKDVFIDGRLPEEVCDAIRGTVYLPGGDDERLRD